MTISYIKSAQKPQDLPRFSLPEIGIIGRSNSGKSTLLNKLFRRKDLVRTGKKPGQTAMIHFFNCHDQWIFADLPGYGFSTTAKHQRQYWQELISQYLHRDNIKIFLFLLDCRRALEQDDIELLLHLQTFAKVWLVQTKIDKIARSKWSNNLEAIKTELAKHNIHIDRIFQISSLKSTNISQLKQLLQL